MSDEERAGVPLTNLDQPLFGGAGATKRDLVDYLDAVADLIIAMASGPWPTGMGGPGVLVALVIGVTVGWYPPPVLTT